MYVGEPSVEMRSGGLSDGRTGCVSDAVAAGAIHASHGDVVCSGRNRSTFAAVSDGAC